MCLQRSLCPLDFLHKAPREALWLNSPGKPGWVDRRLATWGPRRYNGAAKVQRCYCVRSLGDNLESLCQQGQLDKALDLLLRMDREGTVASVNMYRTLLKSCTKRKSLDKARRVHAHLAQHGLESSKLLGEDIVSTLVKCGGLEDALQLFHRLSHRNVFCWTAVIAGYANSGQGQESLRMYELMQEEGVHPNAYTFVSLLKACGSVRDLKAGKRIHADVLKYKCQTDLFVSTCLIGMYGKCGSLEDAQTAFDRLPQQDVVAWNSMLTVYVEQGQADKVLQLYQRMLNAGVTPDNRTFVSTFQACGMLAEKSDVVEDRQSAKANALVKGKGLPEKALLLYEQLRDEGISRSSRTVVIALQACGMLAEKEEGVMVAELCTKRYSLRKGRVIHGDATRMGYDTDIFVGNTLVSMYGKCGSIGDAQKAFNRLSKRNVVTWTVMLGAYLHQGHAEKAVQLYEQMLTESVSPDNRTFVAALQACGMLAEKEEEVKVDGRPIKAKSLRQVEAIHVNAHKKGYDSDLFVISTLISMYGRCGSASHARNVFESLAQRNVVIWSTMIATYVEQGLAEEALQLYEQMCGAGVNADSRTFVSILQACGILADQEDGVVMDGQSTKVKALSMVQRFHADSQMKGHDSDLFVGNTLISMYGKCGSIVDAQSVFDGIPRRDVVTWNAMLAAYVEQGQAVKTLELYERMQEEGASPNNRTLVGALQACIMITDKEGSCLMGGSFSKVKLLKQVAAIHAVARQKGYDADVFVGSALVNVYRKCGSLDDAQMAFDALSHRDVVSWNVLLMVYVEQGDAEKALQLYGQMQEEGTSPDKRTLVNALQACAILADKEEWSVINGISTKVESLKVGAAIHAHAQRKGYDSDVFVGSGLVLMYGKCASIVEAQKVFDGLSHRDVVTWNVMLAAYVKQGHAKKALTLYKEMQDAGTCPDSWTFVSALQACSTLADNEEGVVVEGRLIKSKSLEKGEVIHADARMKGYSSDIFVGSSLVSMYGKCGSIEDAQNVFNGFSQRNVVTWNAMLTAYIEHGQGEKAVQLYQQMQQEGVCPDEITILCILQACGKTGNLAILRQVHHTVGDSPRLANALVHAYGRCGSMMDAQTVFDALPQPDLVSWNTLIAAYARQGNCAASLQYYARMQTAGVCPDGVTFLSLLFACNHAGLVDKGVLFFESMSREHGIVPEIGHYVSMVDLFGRAGCFTRLKELLLTMPLQPNLATWLSVLGACRNHSEPVLGEVAFKYAVRLEPEHPSAYVLMASIYADAGLVDLANKVKKVRHKQGAWKKPGQSWIEHEQEVHNFLVGDTRHSQHKQVYDILRSTTSEMTKAGHIQTYG